MRKLLRRFSYLLNRRQAERDLAEEMTSHREQLDPGRAASFGSALRLREESRDAWGFLWLDQFRQDLACGARTLRRAPGFTLAAILILTMGIGINGAVLHLFNAATFHHFSIRDADTLMRFSRVTQGRGSEAFSFGAISFYREHATLFSYIAGEGDGVAVSLEAEPEPIRSMFVSDAYFTDLGLTPVQGRLLDRRDAEPGAPAVAVLGHRLWQTQFASDPGIVDRVIRLNGMPVQIVGVAPSDFNGLVDGFFGFTAVWLPRAAQLYVLPGSPAPNDFSNHDTAMYGQLKPGIEMAAAEGELQSLTARMREQHPEEIQAGEAVRGGPLQRKFRFESDVAVMLTLIFLILMSACANLGNILLARGFVRQREIEMRMALGAGRWRVIRQLLTESLILAVLGTASGMTAGYFGAKLIMALTVFPPDIHLVMDWRMVAAGAVLALFVAFAFGLAPALQAVRKGPRATRARSILVAVQIAASCVLLILSTMLTRGAQRLEKLDLRFDYQRMLAVNLRPSVDQPTFSGIETRVAQLPAVDGVTLFGGRRRFESNGKAILWMDVAPTYFQFMNLAVARGRTFFAGEGNVSVVSESLARAIWPNEDPVGKTLERRGVARIVVGVVQDSGLDLLSPGTNEAYAPIANLSNATLFVHTAGDLRALTRDLRAAVSVPGTTPSIAPIHGVLGISTDSQGGTLFGVLGGIATALAFIGIFGLVAFAVAQRTREIGVRLAIGAQSSDILRTVIGQYAIALSMGALAGVALAAASAQILQGKLFGLPPIDLPSYAIGLGLFGVVALVAILLPARRALRINPASALRSE